MPLYSSYSDEQLLSLLQDSDEGAFTEIYDRYWERLADTGYYFTKDKQVVEEIVNDVFLRIWNNRTRLQIRSLTDYLGTAVKFGVFKALLKEKRRKSLLESIREPVPTIDMEKELEARFMQDYLNGVIESLPEKSRLIFRYSRKEALSVAEIAQEMNMEPKAVAYHISVTLKKLRIALQRIKFFFLPF